MPTPAPLAVIKALPYGSPVIAVAGKIDKLYPVKTGTGYRLQNGSLLDELTGVEVEFMLNQREEWGVEVYRGGFVEFSGSGMKWCEQFDRAKRSLGKGKIEIQPETAVVRRLAKHEYRGPHAELPLHPTLGDPATPTLAPFPAAAKPDGRARLSHVKDEVARLGSLHSLCMAEAGRLKTTLGEKVAEWPDFLSATTSTLFIQATRDGLHHQVDILEFEAETNPEAAAKRRRNLLQVETLVHGREDKANKLLQIAGHLTNGQTWRDLSEETAAAVLHKRVLDLLSA